MKLSNAILGAAILAGGFSLTSCSNNELISEDVNVNEDINLVKAGQDNGTIIPGKYIVKFKESSTGDLKLAPMNYEQRVGAVTAFAEQVLRDNGISSAEIERAYGSSIKGFAGSLSEADVMKLSGDPRVDYIENDKIVSLGQVEVMRGKPGGGGSGGGAQTTPWGITRVGGAQDGSGRTAWVIDSGVDLDHADLNVDVARSVTFCDGKDSKSADDGNGHGTHVAGTIAALNNSTGVVGVAAGATVVGVKVLGARGSGTNAGVIGGVDYVAANASNSDVANMSLGGGVSTALDDAVKSASGSCKFVLAAGNESQHANNSSPARANGSNIYTISASDVNDQFAYFSNYGNPPVDYCAPGVSINSTWKGGGYNSISGTSMASPHAAGVLLMGNASTDGRVQGDPDGNADSIIHL